MAKGRATDVTILCKPIAEQWVGHIAKCETQLLVKNDSNLWNAMSPTSGNDTKHLLFVKNKMQLFLTFTQTVHNLA